MSRLGGSLVVLWRRRDVTTLVLILGRLGSLGVLRRRGDVATLVMVVVLRLGRGLAALRGRRNVTALAVLVVLRLGGKLSVLRRRGDVATLVLVVIRLVRRTLMRTVTLVVVRQLTVSGALGSGRSLLEVGGTFKIVLADEI